MSDLRAAIEEAALDAIIADIQRGVELLTLESFERPDVAIRLLSENVGRTESEVRRALERYLAKYKFSSVQVNLPEDVAKRVIALGHEIPDEDLAEDGRENEPHITVKYGLHTTDHRDVSDVLADEPPIKATLGRTSLFELEDADVVKIEVQSECLHKMNALVNKYLEHTDTHPGYHPHVTVAYVKKGLGERYANRTNLEGTDLAFTHVLFSSRDGVKTEIQLNGEVDPSLKAAMTNRPIHRAADKHERALYLLMQRAFRSGRQALSRETLEGALLGAGLRAAEFNPDLSQQSFTTEGRKFITGFIKKNLRKAEFNRDQARDESGKWTIGPGAPPVSEQAAAFYDRRRESKGKATLERLKSVFQTSDEWETTRFLLPDGTRISPWRKTGNPDADRLSRQTGLRESHASMTNGTAELAALISTQPVVRYGAGQTGTDGSIEVGQQISERQAEYIADDFSRIGEVLIDVSDKHGQVTTSIKVPANAKAIRGAIRQALLNPGAPQTKFDFFRLNEFNPSQERDERGRWTDTVGSYESELRTRARQEKQVDDVQDALKAIIKGEWRSGKRTSVHVDSHPVTIKAAQQMVPILQEMKNAGYRMPEQIVVDRRYIHSVSGSVYDNKRLSVGFPHEVPVTAKPDDLAKVAFSGTVSAYDTTTDSFAGTTFKDLVVHEMGHIQDRTDTRYWLDDSVLKKVGAVLSTKTDIAGVDTFKRIAFRVSNYARENPTEFVAETFTRLYRGEKLHDDVIKMYKALNGPEIRKRK